MSLEIASDIIQILFYLTATVVAWIGLRTWRAELKGRTEYAAAKQALAKAYSLRDQIRMVQSAWISPSEWAEREAPERESERERKANESYFAYSRRFQKLQETVNELYPVIVEVEAVFGDEGRDRLDDLIAVTRRLWAAIQVYHRGCYEGWDNPEGPNSRYFNIIFGINEFENPDLGSEDKPVDDDNFRRDLDLAIQAIKEYFVPRIGRKTPKL